MHLLYLDDSGSVSNPDDRYIILAGISVFERQVHWLSKALDDLAREYWPDNSDSVEFRAAAMFNGKNHWRGKDKKIRMEAYKKALELIVRSPHATIFATAINKTAISPKDPMEYAFEQISSRFDHRLRRLHLKGDTQRGLIVLDKSSYETSLQRLSQEFRTNGHTWGKLQNIAEVPLFVDSKATRMIQFADMVAYAVRRKYEKYEDSYFDIIKPKFDRDGPVIHGLLHLTVEGSGCNCPCCMKKIGY